MADKKETDLVLEDQEKADKAFEAGYESDDSHQLDDTNNKSTTNDNPQDDKNIDDTSKDQKIDIDPTVNIDEWDGVPAPIRAKFEKMSTALDNATNIANSASGRASKLQSELTRSQKKQQAKIIPTDQQLRDAMGDQEKLNALKEDWPDLAGAMEELKSSVTTAVGGGLDRVKKEVLTEMKSYAHQSQEELTNKIKLDTLHPGWQDTSNSEEFKNWIYEGGPNSQEQRAYNQLLVDSAYTQKSSPGRSAELTRQAAEYYESLLTQYPTWAGEKGNLYGNSSGDAAVKLLNMHKKEFTVAKKDDNRRKKQMLAANVAPTSGNGVKPPPDSSIDVDAAFEEGFTSNNY
jgi:hypothetical protein